LGLDTFWLLGGWVTILLVPNTTAVATVHRIIISTKWPERSKSGKVKVAKGSKFGMRKKLLSKKVGPNRRHLHALEKQKEKQKRKQNESIGRMGFPQSVAGPPDQPWSVIQSDSSIVGDVESGDYTIDRSMKRWRLQVFGEAIVYEYSLL
jgi:hypothetical protein